MRVHLVRESQWLLFYLPQEVNYVRSRKGNLPEEHLVEGNPDGPDIGLTVIGLVIEYLGSHVERRAQDGLCSLVLRAE